MPRFYLHLWNGAEFVVDLEGDELPNVEAAYLEAFEAAKEMAADLIRSHEDPTTYRFDVVDSAGRAVFELPFSEVLGQPRPKRPPSNRPDMKRRRELLASVAEEIMIARAVMASARATLERSKRSSRRVEPPPHD